MTTKTIYIEPDVTEIVLKFSPPLPEPPHEPNEPGIDVSRWQGVIDWGRVATAGIRFAGIRATMGTGRDDTFAFNWREAKRPTLQRMAYHYFVNNTPAMPQLENFLAALAGDYGELPLVLDVEPASGQTINNRQSNTDAIRQWLTECSARTHHPIAIYTAGWAWPICTTVPAWSTEYPLWFAQYTVSRTPSLPHPWTRYMAWQYSNGGRVDGIAGNVDLNRWGDYP